jgi:hypothetical protein
MRRLSILSLTIGIASLGIFSWLAALLVDFIGKNIPAAGRLTITCLFFVITLTGLVLGIISLKKGKRIFAILGIIFNGITIIYLSLVIYVFIYFMTMEPMTG